MEDTALKKKFKYLNGLLRETILIHLKSSPISEDWQFTIFNCERYAALNFFGWLGIVIKNAIDSTSGILPQIVSYMWLLAYNIR